MRARGSLARRLTGTVLLLELIAAVVLIGASAVYEWRMHIEAFDVMLRGRADALLGAVSDAEDQGDNVVLDRTGLTLPTTDIYKVEDEKGRVLGQSKLAIPARLLARVREGGGAAAAKIGGRRYRLLRISGVRIVDPGEAGGGVWHDVSVVYGAQTDHIRQEVLATVRFYAITTLLLLALTALAMVWLMRRGLAPLRQLAAAASKISASGWSFQAPASVTDTAELAPLAEAIEASLARLQRSFEQQRRFTSDAAHELKTDVAIAKSSLQLLAMRSRTAEEYYRGLERCFEDCTRLERAVQEMLTLARVEQGEKMRPMAKRACSSIRECLEESIRQTAPFAELRRVRVQLQIDAEPTVVIEEKDCVLLCSNLLLNAVQHSPADSVVKASLHEREGWTTITIEDQGWGIASSELPYIFDPFYRGEPSRSRASGGTGLGLAICKAICERARGSIEIANRAEPGVRATVLLPVAASTIPSAPLMAPL